MITKKNIIKLLVCLNISAFAGILISSIPTYKIDITILAAINNLFAKDTLFCVPNWFYYLTIIMSVYSVYLCSKQKIKQVK